MEFLKHNLRFRDDYLIDLSLRTIRIYDRSSDQLTRRSGRVAIITVKIIYRKVIFILIAYTRTHSYTQRRSSSAPSALGIYQFPLCFTAVSSGETASA